MPNLKAIRKRIASVKSTQKITRAMKMVAGARLNRAQQTILALRPYAQKTALDREIGMFEQWLNHLPLVIQTHGEIALAQTPGLNPVDGHDRSLAL